MEVMSDKATMEVPSPFAGTITDAGRDARHQGEGRRADPDLRRRSAMRSRRRDADPSPQPP